MFIKKNFMSMFLGIMIIFTSSLSSGSWIGEFAELVGIWKVDGKELYESWEHTEAFTFTGAGYTLVDGEKKIHEQLKLEITDSNIVYTAQVENQNDGKSIPFVLNLNIKESFSFENLEHDFPQKIQYKFEGTDTMHVNVLGTDDKGFSLKFIRQK